MTSKSAYQIKLEGTEAGETLGQRIAYVRERVGLTQKALAELIGKSRPSIVQYEADKISPPLSVIQKLANALEISPELLAFGIDLRAHHESTPHHVKVPIFYLDSERELTGSEYALLPSSQMRVALREVEDPRFVSLDIDAPRFSLSRGDLLLVDPDSEITAGDGKLYAIATSAGLGVIQNAVQLSSRPGEFLLQDGNGEKHSLKKEPRTLGRVCGALVHL